MPNNQELHLQQTQMLSNQDFRLQQTQCSQTKISGVHKQFHPPNKSITTTRQRGAYLPEHKMVLRQISCCQVKQVWKILIQRSRSEARPYILLLIHFILLFRPSISPLLIEYFMAFLMGEMSRWTLFTKLTTSP